MFDEVLYLIKFGEETQDENGFPIYGQETKREVFVDEKSIRNTEFYLASRSGYTLEMMFEIPSLDYEGEEIVEYHFKRYRVVKTYKRKKEEVTELICRAYE